MAEELVQTAVPETSNPLTRAKDYIEEMKQEMRRVTWPSWYQVWSTTGVVVAAVFAFSIYFFLIDSVIGRLIEKLFQTVASR